MEKWPASRTPKLPPCWTNNHEFSSMNKLTENITSDMKTAMRERNKTVLNTLRALKTAITNAAIDKSGAGAELPENEVINIVRKQIKQRQDSIDQFEKAGRAELAATEKEEITILEGYLPTPLTNDEIITIVDNAMSETGASSRKDMGQVMKLVQEKTAGRADGKILSQEVMKRLS